ncbi:MAG: DNA sulfur modification protein DndB [Aeromonadaceae bacterium]
MNHTFEFPATRGLQAGRIFYTITAPISVLHRLITIDDRSGVMARSQRDVDRNRAKKVTEYVLKNPDSWVLPSLTGCIDEEPEFRAMMGSGVGTLVIPMHSVIKLFDGQHRAVGLIDAATQEHSTRTSCVNIQIYVGMTLEQRQQAFTDININAKAVSKGLSMAYDHRNESNRAIAEAVANVPAWKGRIEWQKASCSGATERLFPFKGVVEAFYIYTGTSAKIQPNASQISEAVEFFARISYAASWDDGIGSDGDEMKYRRETSITHHVVGLKALALYGYQARSAGLGIDEAVASLEQLKDDFERSNTALWGNRCVDFEGRMKSNKEAIIETAKMLVEKAGLGATGLAWA